MCVFAISRFLYTVTSLQPTSRAKKSAKIKFSADKIYYDFSQEYPKITNM